MNAIVGLKIQSSWIEILTAKISYDPKPEIVRDRKTVKRKVY